MKRTLDRETTDLTVFGEGEGDNFIERQDLTNGLDMEKYKVAGAMLEQWMLRNTPNLTRWAHAHGIGVTTVLRICQGTYNLPQGPSFPLLWRICLGIADNDARTARRIFYEYTAMLGVTPTAREISVVAELAAVERQLRLIAGTVATWK